jgi:hypothetical protein
MDNLMDVTLPDGKVLKGIPAGTPKEVIEDKLIKSGKYTYEDFGRTPPSPVPADNTPVEEPGWFTKAVDWKKKNMEIGSGLGGALVGIAGGAAVGGPPGAIVGGIIGGMGGSAGGSLLSDYFEGEELNYANAVNEGLISGGIDIATLGLGKAIKPGYFAMKEALGFTPKETAEQILQQAKLGGEPGSRESLMASQNILMREGATLTPFQTGMATGGQIIQEKIARAGLISSNVMEKNMENVNNVVRESIQEVVGRAGTDLYSNPAVFGDNMYQVIRGGKDSLQELYGLGLNEVSTELGTKIVPTAPIKNTLEQFLVQNQREFGSKLRPQTVKYIEEKIALLGDVKSMKATSMLDFEKILKEDIKQFGTFGSEVYNTSVEFQLGQLSRELDTTIGGIVEKASPAASAKYKGIQKQYAEGIQNLLPEVNERFITGASKGHYEKLGEMVIFNGSTDQIGAMYKSIDTAYDLAGRAGAKNLPFASADEAKEAIKQGFLKEKFKILDQGVADFDIRKYAHLADEFNTPREAARLRAVFGNDYPHVKQLLNIMKEASVTPKSNIGELALRGKEYQALAAGASLGSGLVAGGAASGAGIAAGVGVLFTPIFMAKAATNPKNVAKILAFEKKKFTTSAALEIAAANLVADIMFSLPEADQAEVRNTLREQLAKENEMINQQQAAQRQQRVQQQPMP